MKNQPIAVLDIGSDRFCCLVATVSESDHDGNGESFEFLGMGRSTSRGIFQGIVIDMEEAAKVLDTVIRAAEKMSGMSLQSVFVAVSGRHVQSSMVQSGIDVRGEEITQRDMRNLFSKVMDCDPSLRRRQIIHAIPSLYVIDGQLRVRDPLYMASSRLVAKMHVVTADPAATSNIFRCLGQCHIQASRFISAAYAAGMAVLSDDERELGATCIDMGASRTTYALFREGNFIDSGTVSIGGLHITRDIARALGCPLAQAEKIKILYGESGIDNPDNRHDRVSRKSANTIIRARLRETFSYLDKKLRAHPLAGKNIVCTGGGAMIGGLQEVAMETLGFPVRIGTPAPLGGGPECLSHPSFAASVGLLQVAQNYAVDIIPAPQSNFHFPRFAGARISQWLRGRLQTIIT